MNKNKAPRNRTIDLDLEQGRLYLDRCLKVTEKQNSTKELLDKTILGNTFNVLPLLPKESVDLLIADPPYNLTKDFHGKTFKETNGAAYESYTRQWLQLVLPLLKPNASVYICCDWRSSLIIGPIVQEFLKIRNRITWQREKGRGSSKNWKNSLEDIWFATKSDNYTFNLDEIKVRRKVIAPYKTNGLPKDWVEEKSGNYRDTCPSNFWDDITIPFWSMPENTPHPTQKPEKLLAKIILASSNPNDLILDPFLGSGSTGVTAKKLNRHYLGIEENPLYCIWTEKRLEMADTDKEIQGYKNGIFWERNSLKSQKSDS